MSERPVGEKPAEKLTGMAGLRVLKARATHVEPTELGDTVGKYILNIEEFRSPQDAFNAAMRLSNDIHNGEIVIRDGTTETVFMNGSVMTFPVGG